MRRSMFTVAVAVVIVIMTIPALAADNLLINPSLESANKAGTAPLNWTKNRWGTNTAVFSYLKTGHTGTRSVSVKLTNRRSGDAKWYPAPVAVAANTDYVWTEWYQANVVTSVVMMSFDSAGKVTYTDVAVSVPASTAWKPLTYTVRAPATAKTMTMLHIIAKNGTLTIDDAALSAKEVTPPPITLIPNPSLETVSPQNSALPEGWSHSSWGTNKPVYEYKNDGHDGTRSVKVSITSYTSGDAKWTYTPQPLTRGADYRLSAWFKTNTVPHVVAQFIKDDGSEDYFGLPDPVVTGGDWQRYTDVFNVPADAASVSVFFFLTNVGWVQTDQYALEPYAYPAYDQARVTITFDDGFERNVDTVLPVLDQYDFLATYCYATQFVEGLPDQVANVQTIAAAGHETCSHTVTHPDLTTLSASAVDAELAHAQSFLQGVTGAPVTSFASPYGAYNPAVNNEIAKYHLAHRTTDEGFNAKDNLDPYRLRVQNMGTAVTTAQFKTWVDKAKADKIWLILIYHLVDTTGLGEYDTPKADFDAQMAYLKQSGVAVQRLDQALNAVKGQ